MNAPEVPAKKRSRWRFQFSLAALISVVIFINLGFAIYYSGKAYFRPWRTLFEGPEPIYCVALSPDGKYGLSSGGDSMVRLWTLPGGEEKKNLNVYGTPGVAAFAADGRRVFVAGDSGIVIWDLDSGRERVVGDANWIRHNLVLWTTFGFSSSLAFAPGQEFAVVGEANGNICFIDLKSGKISKRIRVSGSPVIVHVLPGEETLLAVGRDRTVQLLSLEDGRELKRFLISETAVPALSPDGRRALFPLRDGTIELWDLDTGKRIWKLAGHPRGYICSLAFSSDGRRAVSGGWDWTIRLWDLERGVEIRKLTGHRNTVNAVALLPDGTHILSGGHDGRLLLWNLAPSLWPFIGAVSLTVAFAAFLVAMKIRARRRARTGGG